MKPTLITLAILTGLAILPDIKGHSQAMNDYFIKPSKLTSKEAVVAVSQPEMEVVLEGCDLANKYDWDKSIARAVCMAESGGNVEAIGDTWEIEGVYAPSYGLMQIRALPGRPEPSQLLDPEFNMQYAYELWQRRGFQPWSAYNNNNYLRFIGE